MKVLTMTLAIKCFWADPASFRCGFPAFAVGLFLVSSGNPAFLTFYPLFIYNRNWPRTSQNDALLSCLCWFDPIRMTVSPCRRRRSRARPRSTASSTPARTMWPSRPTTSSSPATPPGSTTTGEDGPTVLSVWGVYHGGVGLYFMFVSWVYPPRPPFSFSIHEIERRALPEFFNGKNKSKSPEMWVSGEHCPTHQLTKLTSHPLKNCRLTLSLRIFHRTNTWRPYLFRPFSVFFFFVKCVCPCQIPGLP